MFQGTGGGPVSTLEKLYTSKKKKENHERSAVNI